MQPFYPNISATRSVGKQYIAQLIGLNSIYVFERKFLPQSRSDSHCYLIHDLKGGDIIEVSLSRYPRRYFLVEIATTEHIHLIPLTEMEVTKILRGEPLPKPESRYYKVNVIFCRDRQTGRWTKRARCEAAPTSSLSSSTQYSLKDTKILQYSIPPSQAANPWVVCAISPRYYLPRSSHQSQSEDDNEAFEAKVRTLVEQVLRDHYAART